eukprot:UN4730
MRQNVGGQCGHPLLREGVLAVHPHLPLAVRSSIKVECALGAGAHELHALGHHGADACDQIGVGAIRLGGFAEGRLLDKHRDVLLLAALPVVLEHPDDPVLRLLVRALIHDGAEGELLVVQIEPTSHHLVRVGVGDPRLVRATIALTEQILVPVPVDRGVLI